MWEVRHEQGSCAVGATAVPPPGKEVLARADRHRVRPVWPLDCLLPVERRGAVHLHLVLVPTRILGLSAYYHDSAACLVEDGRIVAAAQEERFTRKKHDAGFPSRAVDYCLREAGITTKELDLVGFYEKPLVKFDRLLETYATYAPRGWRSFLMAMPMWLREKVWIGRDINDRLQRPEGAGRLG